MNIATKAYLMFLLLFTNVAVSNKNNYVNENLYHNVNINKTVVSKAAATLKNHYNDLTKALAFRESSNDWTKVNSKSHAIGKYQFTKCALKQIGLSIDYNLFVKDPSIWPEKEQDIAMVQLMRYNKRTLSKYIHKYKGQSINNIKISEHNLIAAAHLAGAQGVMNWIDTAGMYNPSDGHTRISDYLAYFE